jgi:hypothetical protein
VEFVKRVVNPDAVIFQESVELITRSKTQKLLQFGFRQMPAPVFFQRQRFERTAREIAADGA